MFRCCTKDPHFDVFDEPRAGDVLMFAGQRCPIPHRPREPLHFRARCLVGVAVEVLVPSTPSRGAGYIDAEGQLRWYSSTCNLCKMLMCMSVFDSL